MLRLTAQSLWGVGIAPIMMVLSAGTDNPPKFSNTFTTGSIVVAAVVIIAAGLFTLRSHVARIWKDSYEAEKALRVEMEARNVALHEQIVSEREVQQQLRHDLKNQIATLKGENAVLSAKTDLSTLELTAANRHNELMEAIAEQTDVLRLLAPQP